MAGELIVVSVQVPGESTADADRAKAANKVLSELTALLQSAGAVVSKLEMPTLLHASLDRLFLILDAIHTAEGPVLQLRKLLREKIRPGESVPDKIALFHVTQFRWDMEQFPVDKLSDIDATPDRVDKRIKEILLEYETKMDSLKIVTNKIESLRSNSGSVEMEDQLKKKGAMEVEMDDWLNKTFSEVDRLHLHLVALRMHADSVLTYGIGCNYLAIAISPPEKGEKVVRGILDKYVGASPKYALDAEGQEMMAAIGEDDGSDHVQYISVTFVN